MRLGLFKGYNTSTSFQTKRRLENLASFKKCNCTATKMLSVSLSVAEIPFLNLLSLKKEAEKTLLQRSAVWICLWGISNFTIPVAAFWKEREEESGTRVLPKTPSWSPRATSRPMVTIRTGKHTKLYWLSHAKFRCAFTYYFGEMQIFWVKQMLYCIKMLLGCDQHLASFRMGWERF